MAKTLIISDIHLASDVCKAKTLRKFLEKIGREFDRIVILGDLFDHANFTRLKSKHWDLLDTLRDLSKHVEVVWVEGNHDVHIFTEVISHMIGAQIVSQKEHYEIIEGDKKFVLIHGHQFDTFISDMKWWLLAVVATRLYSLVQRFDTENYVMSRYVKRKSKLLLKVSKANRDRAWDYARKHDAQVVICGHTHIEKEETSEDGITYLNTGSWVDSPCGYVVIDSDGSYALCEHDSDKNSEQST